MQHIVVAGAGLAGLSTVKALRARGYEGRLTLVGREQRPPYDRPPLSKQLLAGDVEDSTFETDWAGLDIDFHPGRAATGLTEDALHTTEGELPYDGLVIATGAHPRLLPATDDAPLRTLRTMDDSLKLRERLRPDTKVAIVGSGWIGAEVASTAADLGCRVEVIEAGGTVLPATGLGELAEAFHPWYEQAGIKLRLNAKVSRIEADAVVLEDGTRVPADVVLVGIGVVPSTDWLADSPLEMDEKSAVLTDSRLRTSLPNVYATGDCAAYQFRRYGEALRLEHWTHAQNSPRTIAANLLGADEEYDDVPYVWSRQFGKMVQYLGRHRPSDELVVRGDPAERKWSACWVRDNALSAVLSVGRPREIVDGRMLLAEGRRVDPARLADPETRLAEQ
jgi:3-phenylpropionate/trans-cinnamate dioxygenase ferredoxin reductase subunit